MLVQIYSQMRKVFLQKPPGTENLLATTLDDSMIHGESDPSWGNQTQDLSFIFRFVSVKKLQCHYQTSTFYPSDSDIHAMYADHQCLEFCKIII